MVKKTEKTAKDITLQQLKACAQDLNELGCEPPINEDGTLPELTAEIKEGAEILMPDDELTPVSIQVLTAFGLYPIAEAGTEVAEEEEEGEVPEVPAKAAPAAKVVGNTPAKAAAKEIVEKTKKLTKKAVVLSMIAKKGGATIEEIGAEITRLGIDSDNDKNCMIAKLWLGKMGYDVKKAAIAASPKFTSKA